MNIILYIISILVFTFLIIFVIFGLYYLTKEIKQSIYGYGVPYVPTSDIKIDKLLEILEIKSGQKFLDLGSGDGRILQAVGEKFSDVELYGIERSPHPYKLSQKRKKDNNLNYTVYKKDFFLEDFSKYDIIYSYTISYLMKKIWKKIQNESKKGTLFYSNSFEIKGVSPIDKIETTKGRFIYVYKV